MVDLDSITRSSFNGIAQSSQIDTSSSPLDIGVTNTFFGIVNVHQSWNQPGLVEITELNGLRRFLPI